jgi:Zn-dependent alcohol dehydrogenases
MAVSGAKQKQSSVKAWVAEAAAKPLVLETVDLGPLEAEDVEVAVEHCG